MIKIRDDYFDWLIKVAKDYITDSSTIMPQKNKLIKMLDNVTKESCLSVKIIDIPEETLRKLKETEISTLLGDVSFNYTSRYFIRELECKNLLDLLNYCMKNSPIVENSYIFSNDSVNTKDLDKINKVLKDLGINFDICFFPL